MIPNQTNIGKIIQSQVDALNNALDIVIKAATSTTVTKVVKNINHIKQYQLVLDMLYGKNGIIASIDVVAKAIANGNKIKRKDMKIAINNIEMVLDFLSRLASRQIDVNKLAALKNVLTSALDILTTIQTVFETIAKIKVSPILLLKLLVIGVGMALITALCLEIGLFIIFAPIIAAATFTLALFQAFTNRLISIFTNIGNIKITIPTLVKIWILPTVIKMMVNIILAMEMLGFAIKSSSAISSVTMGAILFGELNLMFKAIRNIKFGLSFFFFRLKIKRIIMGIRLVSMLIRKLYRLKVEKNAPKILLSLLLLNLIFAALGTFFILVTLVAIPAILAIPAMLVLSLALIAVGLVMWVLGKVASKLINGSMVLGLLYMMLILGMMFIMGMMMLVLAKISKTIVKATLWIIGFILVTIVIVALLGAIGYALSFAAPIFPQILLGLGMMIVIVGVLFLLGIMLLFIQMLKLDPEQIVKNVGIVLDTVGLIIKRIFNGPDAENEESDKGWIKSIINFIGGQLVNIIVAIMSIRFLALMVLVILLIVLIATELRVLQELELDKDKILENVNKVISIVNSITEILLYGPTDETTPSDKSWIETIINFVGGSLLTIITAIMSIQKLAMMVLVILLIMFIAGELKILEKISVDKDKIVENVNKIIATVNSIIEILLYGPKDETTESDKGWIVSIIEFVGGSLVTIITAIMSIQKLAMIVLVILLITIISKQLKSLEELDLDKDKVAEKVNIVISCAQSVINAIYGPKETEDNPSKKGWLRKVIEFAGGGGLLGIIDAIMALAWFGLVLGIICLVKLIAENLNYINQFKIEGDITQKVNNIIDTANAVILAVTNRKETTAQSSKNPKKKRGLIGSMFPGLAKIADELAMMGWVSDVLNNIGIVIKLAEHINAINECKDVSNAKNKALEICNTADEVIKMIIAKPELSERAALSRLSILKQINMIVSELTRLSPAGIKKSQEALEGHINLVKKIGDIDLSKLQISANMFKNMADFSKSINGNFKELAESINEELMPLLKELKELAEKVPEKLEKGFQDTSASIAAANENPVIAGIKKVKEQVFREKPNVTEKEAENEAKKRINERSIADANGIAAKLDELISILKGQNGQGAYVHIQS